ncbi:hypothetical protein SCUCBS95973_005421 [Sporothrix curviconia]|uniref:Uncharacterized protein n=1 Tax=Sporothrix curviconia TaxID=1260050 RepID=A0ABP0BWX0_9PEZI
MIINYTVQAALTLNVYANLVAFNCFGAHSWKFYLIYTCWILLELLFVYFNLAKVIDGPVVQVADLDVATAGSGELSAGEKEMHFSTSEAERI